MHRLIMINIYFYI